MGKNYSRQLVDMTQQIISTASTKIVNSLSNRSDYNFRNDQTLKIDWTGADFNHCPLTIAQESEIMSRVLNNNTTKFSDEVTNDISSQIDALVTQTLEQVNKSIPVFDENEASVTMRIRQLVKQQINVSLQNSISNVLSTNASNDQVIDIGARYFKCRNSPITMTQSSTIDTIASSTANSTIENVVRNSEVAALKAQLEQKVSQVNAGLDFGFLLFLLLAAVAAFAIFVMKKTKGVTKGIWKYKKQILLGLLGLTTTGIGVYYALIRSGKVDNPFAPDVAK
jgi:hypothetical protein